MKKSQYLAITIALIAGSVRAYAQKGDAAKGKEVFEQCAVCHNADSAEQKMGPGLKGLYKAAKMKSTGKAPSDATVGGKIDEGGGGMPAYKEMLSAPEKANLLAYLKTL